MSDKFRVPSMDPLTGEKEERRMSLKEILTRCADLSGVTPDDVRGKSRHRTIIEARAEYCRRANSAGYSWNEIALYIHKTHSSCIAIAKRIRKNTAKPLPFWGSPAHEREKDNKPGPCIYCRGSGAHGDEFTGGTSYCRCPAGTALKNFEKPSIEQRIEDERMESGGKYEE